jgi:hypothetical protein
MLLIKLFSLLIKAGGKKGEKRKKGEIWEGIDICSFFSQYWRL